jgi:hypothetical protein
MAGATDVLATAATVVAPAIDRAMPGARSAVRGVEATGLRAGARDVVNGPATDATVAFVPAAIVD